MKLTKRILSFICVVAMVLSMCAVSSFAAEKFVDETVGANWKTMAAKYSKQTGSIIAPQSNNNQIREDGFRFELGANNAIKVVSAPYDDNKGVYPVSVVSSKNTTKLDGLSVEILPDDIDMVCDDNESSTQFTVLFTEAPVDALSVYNADNNSYDTGLYNSLDVLSNGFRELCPDGSKSLAITVSNQWLAKDGHFASSVAIIYDNGTYKNCDGHTGFRWVFTARNFTEQTAKGDSSGITQCYEEIDFSDGLNISVRADDVVGYIVTVNGKDYYEGTRVGYFPDCSTDTFKGTSTEGSYNLSDSDYIEMTDAFINSMTFAQEDIDLNALTSVTEGYVTIGVSGTENQNQKADITVSKINGHPAATWKGQAACTEHTFADEFTVVKEPDCKNTGLEAKLCTNCGAYGETQEIAVDPDAHVEGIWKVTTEPTYEAEGEETLTCKNCDTVLDTRVLDRLTFQFPEDCDANAWYAEGVQYCMQKGYFSGNDKGQFMPNDVLTREQFVVVLAKLDGVDLSAYEGSDFADVPATHWAAKSIKWAAEMKYTSGTGNGNFGLGVQITREQLATFFYNYAKGTGKDVSGAADLTVFTDHAQISGWATTGLAWAVDAKMITGTSATTVSPLVTANRATAARLFMLYDQNINAAE